MVYYCVYTHEDFKHYELLYHCLPFSRKAKVDKLIRLADKYQAALSYCLLQYSLKINNIKILYQIDKYNKPYDASGKCYFNTSHCEKAVACIIGDLPNGIDIDRVINHDCYRTIVKKVCNNNEIELLNNSKEPLVEFTKLWTFKESYLKMVGTGIVGDLKRICYENCNICYESNVYKNYVLTYCSSSKEKIIEVSINEIIHFLNNSL